MAKQMVWQAEIMLHNIGSMKLDGLDNSTSNFTPDMKNPAVTKPELQDGQQQDH
jgi:hypothetical protein